MMITAVSIVSLASSQASDIGKEDDENKGFYITVMVVTGVISGIFYGS